MRFFFVALAETTHIREVMEEIAALDDEYRRRVGVRVGVLIRFTKWRVCVPCRLAERLGIPVFVDNSAFDFMSRGLLDSRLGPGIIDKLRRWVERYASWLSVWHNWVDVAALPDVPTHGSRFVEAAERLERIRLTAELHRLAARLLRAREPEALSKTIIVLQGFEVPEYQLSAMLELTPELYETCTLGGGCPYENVAGVGSVCVRKPTASGKTGRLASGVAAGTLERFMREFLEARWPRELRAFHFFGLHYDAVRLYARHPRFYASDTGAHGISFRYKWRTALNCRQPDAACYRLAVRAQVQRTLSALLQRPLPTT